ncbi:MAG: Gfo/Idh/MocA family oxidoreductase [Cyanobacteria bacterium J06648_11]
MRYSRRARVACGRSVIVLRVGIVGTGFAARLRAEALRDDERAKLVAVAGHTKAKATQFGTDFQVAIMQDWPTLIHSPRIDVVFICTVNRDHATIAKVALDAGKHVVVEYPLALQLDTAVQAIELAERKQRLLHVEHIELLSGIHTLIRQELAGLGAIFHANYTTLKAVRPAPARWTYDPELFGFPLVGAQSRLHRLVDLFGPVERVACQLHYDTGRQSDRYTSCMCNAQLEFTSGTTATVTYGKGESIWQSQRKLELYAKNGGLLVDGDRADLIRAESAYPLKTGTRRGLFYQDTRRVMDYLCEGTPLYVSARDSLQSLAVAIAAAKSAETKQIVTLTPIE